jgi:hypothetical protein
LGPVGPQGQAYLTPEDLVLLQLLAPLSQLVEVGADLVALEQQAVQVVLAADLHPAMEHNQREQRGRGLLVERVPPTLVEAEVVLVPLD